jgi:hypothetical protein
MRLEYFSFNLWFPPYFVSPVTRVYWDGLLETDGCFNSYRRK